MADHIDADDKPTIIGDSAYADGATREHLGGDGFEVLYALPASAQLDGVVHQGPLHGGPRRWHRDLSSGPHRDHPTVAGQGRQGQLDPHCRRCPCEGNAPRRVGGARSPSTPKRRSSNGPEPFSRRRSGSPATAPTGPSWNARSPTSSGVPGEGSGPRAPGLYVGWPRTSTLELPPSTGPVSPCSAWPAAMALGHSPERTTTPRCLSPPMHTPSTPRLRRSRPGTSPTTRRPCSADRPNHQSTTATTSRGRPRRVLK